MDVPINLVKVFSVTRMKDRQSLGERVTDWIAANPTTCILETVVALTSDSEFHCLSIVLICDNSKANRAKACSLNWRSKTFQAATMR